MCDQVRFSIDNFRNVSLSSSLAVMATRTISQRLKNVRVTARSPVYHLPFPLLFWIFSILEHSVCPNGGSPLRSNSKMRSCATTDPCPVGYECSQVDGNGVTQRRCCPTKGKMMVSTFLLLGKKTI